VSGKFDAVVGDKTIVARKFDTVARHFDSVAGDSILF
jgi:hypothetical protein